MPLYFSSFIPVEDVLKPELIKTVSHDQHQILRWILQLQKTERFDVDLTYGRGKFYRNDVPQPRLKFDRWPAVSGVVPSDAARVPIPDGSVKSVVFDPPFLATKGPSTRKKGPISPAPGANQMINSFGRFDTEGQLFEFYGLALRECWRILEPKGFLVVKTQDKVSSGRQYWSHVWFANEAERLGFYLKDLFVLLAKSRMTPAWQLANQQHARKFHAYFLLLERKR